MGMLFVILSLLTSLHSQVKESSMLDASASDEGKEAISAPIDADVVLDTSELAACDADSYVNPEDKKNFPLECVKPTGSQSISIPKNKNIRYVFFKGPVVRIDANSGGLTQEPTRDSTQIVGILIIKSNRLKGPAGSSFYDSKMLGADLFSSAKNNVDIKEAPNYSCNASFNYNFNFVQPLYTGDKNTNVSMQLGGNTSAQGQVADVYGVTHKDEQTASSNGRNNISGTVSQAFDIKTVAAFHGLVNVGIGAEASISKDLPANNDNIKSSTVDPTIRFTGNLGTYLPVAPNSFVLSDVIVGKTSCSSAVTMSAQIGLQKQDIKDGSSCTIILGYQMPIVKKSDNSNLSFYAQIMKRSKNLNVSVCSNYSTDNLSAESNKKILERLGLHFKVSVPIGKPTTTDKKISR